MSAIKGFNFSKSMYILNITFLCAKEELEERTRMLKEEMLPALNVAPARRATLMILSDVPGSPDFHTHERTLPLQIEFDSKADRDVWMQMVMMPALEEYQKELGERGLVMVSLLDVLERCERE